MGGKASQPEPPKPAPNLQDAASNLDQKIEELGAKIQKADEEARQWVAKQSTDATAKARAMQALKRKKLYEQQRDQLVDTQFNVENLAFQQEQAEITAGTVAAMKKATDQLKNQTQKIGVDQVDKLTDEMADIAAEMKDIQSALAAPSAVGSAAEDEAEKELMALYAQQEDKEAEEAMSILAAGGGGYASTTPDAIFDMMNSSSASGCLKIACGHYSDGLMPCGLDALDVVSLFDHPNLGGAGLHVREVRTLRQATSDIGLIVSCGSPVVLTEPVDLREHVAKTTAAMLQFPNAPVVGICYGMQLLTLLYGGKLAEPLPYVDGVETFAGEVSAVLLPFFMLAICEDWRQFTSKQLTSALLALGRQQDWQAALRLLHDVQGSDSCHAETNIFSYGAAIAACERSAQWAWALQLLDDLITNGFEPNVIVWSSACSACDKAEHWLESLRLLKQMPGKKLQPNVISYGAALSACARVAKWQHAIALLEDVSAEDIDMNIVLWNSAITACARAGEWPLALRLLELLQQEGLQPDVLSFNACITAAGAGSRWQLALSLFDLAESVGRSVVTYNAVLAAFEAAGEWLPALSLLRQLRSSEALSVDNISFASAISACQKASRWERSLQLLWQTEASGLSPDIVCFNAAISACDRCFEWQRSLWLLRELCRRRLRPDAVTFACVVSACAKTGRWSQALSLLRLARTRAVEVGSFAASSLLRSSSVAEPMEGCTGAWQSSIDAVKSLRCSNLKLDIVGGNAMLVTASTAQRWGWIQALSMLAEMAFCSLALSEVRYLHILALFCLFVIRTDTLATSR
ncbi:unnamed protein product [Symbiodinium necroappetens]|uniref:Pentatricopeptide repeat-containing protein, chloroplastic n=1 Tax=Symbiodinium necroappetens TaxID=1628268 RepID=A0A812M344_9DINO|nr:unnamed protein product [Symbiodinium necroappetens]